MANKSIDIRAEDMEFVDMDGNVLEDDPFRSCWTYIDRDSGHYLGPDEDGVEIHHGGEPLKIGYRYMVHFA